jgi:hypothetical protein
MARAIAADSCREADVRALGYRAARVFSTPHDGRAVRNTPQVMTGHHPLGPGSRCIAGTPCRRREALISQLHAVQNGKSRAKIVLEQCMDLPNVFTSAQTPNHGFRSCPSAVWVMGAIYIVLLGLTLANTNPVLSKLMGKVVF